MTLVFYLHSCWNIVCYTSDLRVISFTNIADAHSKNNQWIDYLTSADNRHALPLFTSLLNVTCAYDPIGYGVPYNHLMFNDSREALVEVALQLLCVSLETSGIDTGNADEQVEVCWLVNFCSKRFWIIGFSFI